MQTHTHSKKQRNFDQHRLSLHTSVISAVLEAWVLVLVLHTQQTTHTLCTSCFLWSTHTHYAACSLYTHSTRRCDTVKCKYIIKHTYIHCFVSSFAFMTCRCCLRPCCCLAIPRCCLAIPRYLQVIKAMYKHEIAAAPKRANKCILQAIYK
jgi:hypothetical protein